MRAPSPSPYDHLAIPESFGADVLRIFGPAGAEWLEALPEILDSAVERFAIRSLAVAEGLSINLICFAETEAYGDAVLKIGVPNPEIRTEIDALIRYGGRLACRLYEYDLNRSALLLERLSPGIDLYTVADLDERVRIGARIIAGLPLPIDAADESRFPTILDWIEAAFSRARSEARAPASFLSLLDDAESVYDACAGYSPEPRLLHGDLHHMNILFDRTRGWRVIDPKGAIGPAIFECGRFVQNHLDHYRPGEKLEGLRRTAALLAEGIGSSADEVLGATFVDFVLSRTWSYEEHLSDAERSELDVEVEFMAGIYRGALPGRFA